MTVDTLRNHVRQLREAAGLTQAALAEAAGVARQTLVAVEQGRSVPSTALSLKLARALGARVEQLFALDDEEPPEQLARWPRGAVAPVATRCVVGQVKGQLVAHPLEPTRPETWLTAADGVARADKAGRARVRMLGESFADPLLVAGCAPALGVLASRLEARRGENVAVRWVHASSTRALEHLVQDTVHLAGTHYVDLKSGAYNVPLVRQRLKGRPTSVVTLTQWEAGLAVKPGNPLALASAVDLLRPGLRVVRREAGSGAHRLLESLLGARAAGLARLKGPVAASHEEAARLVALGLADAALTLACSATAQGTGFIPLAEERFDLVVPRPLLADARARALLDALSSSAFRRDAQALGGHRLEHAGRVVAEVGG